MKLPGVTRKDGKHGTHLQYRLVFIVGGMKAAKTLPFHIRSRWPKKDQKNNTEPNGHLLKLFEKLESMGRTVYNRETILALESLKDTEESAKAVITTLQK